jgi:HEAT repeat protein
MTDTIYNYAPPVSELLSLGDPRQRPGWVDYLALGLTEAHVPELIRMVQDEDLNWADSESDEVWAPLHAWRALGALRAEAAIEPLLTLLPRIDEYDDDWVMEDLPDVFERIGQAAVPALGIFLADDRHGLWARVTAASSLGKIGQAHPQAREVCIAALNTQLAHFNTMDEELNGFIVNALVDLKAVEAAPMMERAFAADKVDIFILGDWEDAQIALGLLDKRLTPPPEYVWLSGSEIQEYERDKTEHRAQSKQQNQAKAKAKAKRKQAQKNRRKQRKKKK